MIYVIKSTIKSASDEALMQCKAYKNARLNYLEIRFFVVSYCAGKNNRYIIL